MTSVLGRQKGKDTQKRKPREDGGRSEGGSPLHGMPGAKGKLKEAEEDSPQESGECGPAGIRVWTSSTRTTRE